MKNWDIEKLCRAGRHDFIEITRRILAAPGVVIPIDNRETRIGIAREKNRPVIAAPRLICWNPIKRDAVHRESAQRCAPFGFMCAVANIYANPLRLDEGYHH